MCEFTADTFRAVRAAKATSPQWVKVVVPSGAAAGDQVPVQTPSGAQYMVVVPPGMSTGQSFYGEIGADHLSAPSVGNDHHVPRGDYICVRHGAVVRSDPTPSSPFSAMLKPGTRVTVVESTTLNGHVCARLKTIDGVAVNSISWVSLQVYPKTMLFEPLVGGGYPCGRKAYYKCCGKTCCKYEAAVATVVGVPVAMLGATLVGYMACQCLDNALSNMCDELCCCCKGNNMIG